MFKNIYFSSISSVIKKILNQVVLNILLMLSNSVE